MRQRDPRRRGSENLAQLRELNLARNRVERCAEALLANARLASLNLADNLVGSFSEIVALGRLPELRELRFRDPHWGGNPVSGLSNYQTFTLFTIPTLVSLDTVPLAEETKALAEATYMKKKMFYNMKAKSMRKGRRRRGENGGERSRRRRRRRRTRAHGGIASNQRDATRDRRRGGETGGGGGGAGGAGGAGAEETREAKAEEAKEEAKEEGAKVEAKEEAKEGASEGASSSSSFADRSDEPATATAAATGFSASALLLRSKRARLEAAASSLIDESSAVRRAFEECEATSRRLCEARVRRAMVELETGGNVRLEEGKPTDAWFRSCAELAAGRFFEGDYRSEGRPGNRPTGFASPG